MTIKECKDYIYNKKYEIKNNDDLDFLDSVFQYLCFCEKIKTNLKRLSNNIDYTKDKVDNEVNK